jgi:hypothetical protein
MDLMGTKESMGTHGIHGIPWVPMGPTQENWARQVAQVYVSRKLGAEPGATQENCTRRLAKVRTIESGSTSNDLAKGPNSRHNRC